MLALLPSFSWLEPQGSFLDQMPGKEGEAAGKQSREDKDLPPFGVAVHEPDHDLLRRPPENVEPVGGIAEASRRNERQLRMQRQVEREIAAEEREEQDKLTERDAEHQACQREQRDSAVEDPRVAQRVEEHADGEEAHRPAPAAEKAERVGEGDAGHAERQERDAD